MQNFIKDGFQDLKYLVFRVILERDWGRNRSIPQTKLKVLGLRKTFLDC